MPRIQRLKRVETTRWFSLSSALNTAILTFNAVIDSLEKFRKMKDVRILKAEQRFNGIFSFWTIYSYRICMFRYFFIVDPLTRILQSINIDLLGSGAKAYVVTIL